mgnify:CR=1 FL=1
MAQEGSTAAAADKKKKRSAKKKRKISKHILQANKDHVELQKARDTEDNVPDIDLVGDATPMVTPAKKVGTKKRTSGKKKQANMHTKDIKEAAGYLSNWKHHKDAWKFNKNTQSWLIRHMYEADKVSKTTFTLLLEYLEGLKGEGAKTRILEEATRRALRYKKYSEENGGDSKDEEGEDGEKKNNTKAVSFSEDTKEESSKNNKKKKQPSQKEQQAAMDEQTRWENLDDHDKRKEYKRARKVLETVRDAANSEKQSGGDTEQ